MIELKLTVESYKKCLELYDKFLDFCCYERNVKKVHKKMEELQDKNDKIVSSTFSISRLWTKPKTFTAKDAIKALDKHEFDRWSCFGIGPGKVSRYRDFWKVSRDGNYLESHNSTISGLELADELIEIGKGGDEITLHLSSNNYERKLVDLAVGKGIITCVM